MDAKELRIGNILNAVVSNGVETFTFNEIVVHELTKDGMKDEKGFRFPYDTIVGIPLNEWWLLEFGFFHSESLDMYLLKIQKEKWICWNKDKGITLQDVNRTLFEYKKIKYVHQLQNLYFATQQEELKLEQS
ncbi:hypothetical protein [Chryseobacterium sp. 2VB]|uniref:hypothetical protein n=1 Tax=Chryseobacterium sp. 2VB TaxID=2502204 RepID=UPI0010FA23B0|nr:hypothetical protein [Chryseobacterium sp. 2VB]